MFCIISFIVLSILGIFSASNRQLAREALDCVFRRVTFRPCNTGFDEKMKAKILGKVIVRSENAARFLNKNFELLSWVFFIALLTASIFFVRGVFLFYTTGSCNGLNESGFCVFDPTGENNQVSSLEGCKVTDPKAPNHGLTLDGVDLTGLPVMNAGAQDKIVFVGCYACDYTRKAYPMIRDLVNRYHAEFVFAHYPTKEKSDYLSRVGYCVYNADKDKYWELNDALFAEDKSDLENVDRVQEILAGLGLDTTSISACANEPQTEPIVQKQMDEIKKTNFYGTPTIFFNGEPLVGPKPYRVYAIQLKGLFYWLR